MRSHGLWLAALASLVLAVAVPSEALAARPKRDPPLLFGGPVNKPKRVLPLDPRLPTGAEIPATEARPSSLASICSLKRPVCAHATSPGAVDHLRDAVGALERAYESVVLALGMPGPLPDNDAGGSDSLDFYLGGSADDLRVVLDGLLPGRLDAAPVFCSGYVASAALLARQASLCVGEALAARLDAGESAQARRAFALELWWITGAPTSLDVETIDGAAQHPEQALAFDAMRGSSATGRLAMLLETLEFTRSVSTPGMLTASLYSAGASRTPPDSASFNNEPDLFDVLRHSVEEELPRYADLLVDFALRRALAGDRDDGTHLPGLGFAGSFARARYDWVLPFSSLPRRVASGVPIAPTGAELIWVELDDAPIGATIGFRAEWEATVPFQWRLLLIDREGRELRRVDVTFQERAHLAEARVLRLDGAKALIVAGVNLGGVDLSFPFDPDMQPFEPAGCTVYLASM